MAWRRWGWMTMRRRWPTCPRARRPCPSAGRPSGAAGRQVDFACSPENLRLGKAIAVFTDPGRIIVGVRNEAARAKLEPLLAPICDTIFWIGLESAEMTKHALNAFLATSITFANEI